MIQLNLLPDVKLQYIKAQKQRRLVFSVSILVAAISVGILAFLLGISGLQKKHLGDLNKDIGNYSSELKGEPNIQRILTVQNQLESLTQLHSNKPAASRLFDFLNQVTPATVNITDFKIDFKQDTATITGTSDSLADVNQYVDTLKYTKYVTKDNKKGQLAFGNVVLSNFNLNTDSQNAGQAANYDIDLSFDPTIFNITKQNVMLSVPNTTTTRLNTQQPTDLFQAAPSKSNGAQNGGF